MLLDNDFHPDHNAFMRSELEAFSQNSGWKYEVIPVAGFQGTGDLNQLLVASIQAGNAADILIKDSPTRQLQFLGALESVDDIVKELAGKLGDPQPGMVASGNFDGQWWGVPLFTRSGGLWARKDLFQAAGIDINTATDTYDTMRDNLLKVSDPDKKLWGWGMTVNRSGDGTTGVREPLMRFGSQLQDKDGQLVKFNSPETISGFKWLKETYTDAKWVKMLPPGINSWTDPSNNEAMLAGSIAVTDNAGTVYAKGILDKVPFFKDVIILPRPKRISDGKRLDSMGGTKIYAIKGTKNKDAAYDLIRHMTTLPVQQRIWTISTGYACPAYKNGWDDPLIQGNEVNKRVQAIIYNTGEPFNGIAWPGPTTAATDAIDNGTYYTDAMADILAGKAIEEVVKTYHDKIVQVYKDFGFKGA